jgi:hypothetical protein
MAQACAFFRFLLLASSVTVRDENPRCADDEKERALIGRPNKSERNEAVNPGVVSGVVIAALEVYFCCVGSCSASALCSP